MLTIDASVALKFFLNEPGSDEARAYQSKLMGGRIHVQHFFIAPVIFFLEVHNTLAKHFRREAISVETFTGAHQKLREFIGFTEIDESLAESARFMSIYANAWVGGARPASTNIHPPFNIYDCLYIAHAKQHGSILLTADREQAEIANKAFGVSVELIRNAA